MTMNFTKFTQLPKKDPEHTFRVRVSGDHTKQLLEKVITVPPATDEQQLDALIRQAFEDCLKQLVKGIR